MAAGWCAQDLARARVDRAKDWELASYVCKLVVVFGFSRWGSFMYPWLSWNLLCKLRLSASASQVLGSKACATPAQWGFSVTSFDEDV